jgi:prepilin signal peptidase PulO-like enzyme (type II secretory pathway)
MLKGKCRYCHKKISIQYPLVEIATALLFLLIFNQNLFFTFFLFIISCFFIIIFVYDLKHLIIPDKVIYPAIAIVLIFNFWNFIGNCLPAGKAGKLIIENFANNLIAAFIGAIFFLLIFLISRGKWIGFGDVKLGFLMGLFLGFPQIITGLFFAYLIGAIIGTGLILLKRKKMKSEVAFGPFLVLGTFIAFFWGNTIINWYLNLFL